MICKKIKIISFITLLSFTLPILTAIINVQIIYIKPNTKILSNQKFQFDTSKDIVQDVIAHITHQAALRYPGKEITSIEASDLQFNPTDLRNPTIQSNLLAMVPVFNNLKYIVVVLQEPK
jgi:hypothetical protein